MPFLLLLLMTLSAFRIRTRVMVAAAIGFCLCVLPKTATAQELAPLYSGQNEITLTLPGKAISYAYFSNQLLIRLDREARKLEFRVPIASFVPANTGSPQVLLRELLLASSFPDLVFRLDAPLDLLLSEQTQPDARLLKGVLITQGASRDIQTDMQVVPLPNQASLSASFRFSLSHPDVVLPVTYATMVEGMAEVVFQNARWLNPNPDNR